MRQINDFKFMGLWGLMSDLVDVQKALVAQRWTAINMTESLVQSGVACKIVYTV